MSSVHQFQVEDIDGNTVSLSDYQGKVLLFVNVASECGFTPQYEGLQALSEEYADKDFLVLGFPSNDFGKQEPGSNKEIKFFCTENYDVTFPMFAKIPVKGDDAHPLYQYLTTAGDVSWNFNKYLVGKNGEVIQHFESAVKPGSDELKEAIDQALED